MALQHHAAPLRASIACASLLYLCAPTTPLPTSRRDCLLPRCRTGRQQAFARAGIRTTADGRRPAFAASGAAAHNALLCTTAARIHTAAAVRYARLATAACCCFHYPYLPVAHWTWRRIRRHTTLSLRDGRLLLLFLAAVLQRSIAILQPYRIGHSRRWSSDVNVEASDDIFTLLNTSRMDGLQAATARMAGAGSAFPALRLTLPRNTTRVP